MHRKTKGKGWEIDAKWDSGAKVEVERFADRWTCEIAIPSSNFRDGLPKKLPAELFRCRMLKTGSPKDGQWYIWGPLSSRPSDFERFGTWELAK